MPACMCWCTVLYWHCLADSCSVATAGGNPSQPWLKKPDTAPGIVPLLSCCIFTLQRTVYLTDYTYHPCSSDSYCPKALLNTTSLPLAAFRTYNYISADRDTLSPCPEEFTLVHPELCPCVCRHANNRKDYREEKTLPPELRLQRPRIPRPLCAPS